MIAANFELAPNARETGRYFELAARLRETLESADGSAGYPLRVASVLRDYSLDDRRETPPDSREALL